MDNEEKRLFANVEFNLDTATKMIANLVSQNANLQQKINEAIKYIEMYCPMLDSETKPIWSKILKILGGNNEK